jgi:IclR family mhp operon transcriptional activator
MTEKPNEIQPIIRALNVLEALNLQTSTSLAALHDETGLPKSTLVRLLDTLIAGGYVHRVSRKAGYEVGERVLRLSGGFRHQEKIVEAARPFLSALTAQHKWPVGLATPEADQMLVRASTRAESPFATDHDFLGLRIPMLLSALGRAYIAYCDDEERETMMALMRNSKARRNAMARDDKTVARLIAGIRKRGFATTTPQPGEPLQGMAVPVMENGKAVAAITLRYFSSAMSEAEAARRYVKSLQETAEAVAAGL